MMRRRTVLVILCALSFTMVSFGGLANVQKNFGTAEVDLDDTSADATCPSISDFLWDRSDEGDDDWMDVEISCEFRDSTSNDTKFNFNIQLVVELWYISPSQFKGPTWSDSWTVDDYSRNWINVPVVHQDTLSISILWRPPASNEKYRCELFVSIENEDADVIDAESDAWFITMQL